MTGRGLYPLTFGDPYHKHVCVSVPLTPVPTVHTTELSLGSPKTKNSPYLQVSVVKGTGLTRPNLLFTTPVGDRFLKTSTSHRT